MTLIDDFEDGDLSTKSPYWSDWPSGLSNVQTTNLEGSRALELTGDASFPEISRNSSAYQPDEISYLLYQIESGFSLFLQGGSSELEQFFFSSAELQLDSEGFSTVASLSYDTPYEIRLSNIDYQSETYTLRVKRLSDDTVVYGPSSHEFNENANDFGKITLNTSPGKHQLDYFNAVEYLDGSLSSLSVSSTTDSSVELAWTDDISNESGYRVYRDTSAGVDRTQANQVADLSANTESYTDTSLTDSTEYYYVVEAYNVDETAASSEVAATTDPAAPSDTTLDTTTSREITVSWTDNSTNEDGYRVYRSQSDGGYTEVADLATDTTTYTDTGLEDGEQYWYYVEAYVGSKTASGASVSGVTPLPSASSLAVVESAQDEATASWTNEDNSSDGSIAVERSTDGFSSVTTVAGGLSPSTTEYVDTTVDGTETYEYRIERTTDHATATSGTASVTINGPPWFSSNAEQPTNGATGVSRSPTLTVEVNDPDGNPVDVTFYDASDDTQIGQTQTDVPSGSSTSVEWSGRDFATTYSWYAIADDGLETTQSPTFSFTVADGIPQNVAVSATAENEVTVEWDAVAVAAGYYVYRAASSGSTASDYTQVADVTSPPFVDTDVVDGERYYYRVSSHD